MKSGARRLSIEYLLTGMALGCAALLIGPAQPRLLAALQGSQRTPDAYLLPEPEQTLLMSLGYRSALADLLYATTRVQYGLHAGENRRFEFAGSYLDTITTLDPTFQEPYLYADTFITLQTGAAGRAEFWEARRIFEKGMRHLPYDTRLWFTAGQYMAYLAAPHLSEEERAEWRVAGAHALGRACELAGEHENIPYHCMTAAGLLSRAGEQEALVQMLTRTIAVTDDEEIREQALQHLRAKVSEQVMEIHQRRVKSFQQAWARDLPFVSQDLLLLLGPRIDSPRCAGIPPEPRAACATSWNTWTRLQFGAELD